MEIDFAMAIVKNIGIYSSKLEQCDVIIFVEDQKFSCKSFHLSACSEFFQVLMRFRDTRSKSKHCENLVIRGINSDIFALVLDAIFKGENKISETNVIEMWYSAHHLQINFLIQKCETFIVDHLTVDNYLHFYPHAARLKSETVLDNICEIMVMNFDDFRQTETFLKLPVDHLVAVVKSEGFRSYDSVVESILQWVEYEEVSNADTRIPKPGDKNEDCHHEKNSLIEVEQVRSIEVLFSNENFILEKSVDRKELVGRIMANVNLGLVSKEGIKILIHNDLVMDNRDARSIVCKALLAQVGLERAAIRCSVTNAITDVVVAGSTSMEVNNPVHTNSLPPADSNVSSNITNPQESKVSETCLPCDNLQPVFIFLDVNKKLMAYNIVTNKFFSLANNEYVDVMLYKAELYLLRIYKKYSYINPTITKFSHLGKATLEIEMDSFHEKEIVHYIVNGAFVYRLLSEDSELQIFRFKDDNKNKKFVCVGQFTTQGILSSVVNLNDKIVAIFNVNEAKKKYVYTFSTLTRMLYEITGLSSEKANSLATFSLNEKFFILQGDGTLIELLEKDDKLKTVTRTSIWDTSLKIRGAAMWNKTLYVVASLTTQMLLPSSCHLGPLKFIKAFPNVKRCQYSVVDKGWLTREI